MATRNALITYPQRGVIKVEWTGLLNGDQGDYQSLGNYPDKTISVRGTFGAGGSVSIQGTNDGGTTSDTINDSRGEGNALTFTAQDMRTILENPQAIRPNVTAGDGTTSLTVTMYCQNLSRN